MATTPTHRVTVTAPDDSTPIKRVPARFSEGTNATEGVTDTAHGDVDVDEPRVRFDARDVGTLSWSETDPDDGDRGATYARDIDAGSGWRLTIHGHDGGQQFAITDVREHYARGPAPTAVVAILKDYV